MRFDTRLQAGMFVGITYSGICFSISGYLVSNISREAAVLSSRVTWCHNPREPISLPHNNKNLRSLQVSFYIFVIISRLALGVEGVIVLKQLDCEVTQVHLQLRLRMLAAINHHFPFSSQHGDLNPHLSSKCSILQVIK